MKPSSAQNRIEGVQHQTGDFTILRSVLLGYPTGDDFALVASGILAAEAHPGWITSTPTEES